MSDAAVCRVCGLPAAPRLTARGAVAEYHTPGGPLCRVGTWAREVAARGLVRVEGAVLIDLTQRVEVVYGPRLRTQGELLEEATSFGWVKVQARPGVVTSAWAPDWAVAIVVAFGPNATVGKDAAIERARRDPEWREALVATAHLASDGEAVWSKKVEAAVRRAVVAFCEKEV